MDIINQFKDYLVGKKINNPITLKNYISDLRHFISWYEKSVGPFSAYDFDEKIIKLYEGSSGARILPGGEIDLSEKMSHASLKRRLSSLRQFAKYLTEENILENNPFLEIESESSKNDNFDHWHIQEFKDYLKFKKASDLTVKNYITDIHSFRRWHEQAIEPHTGKTDFPVINDAVVEEYKNRLIEHKGSAPRTINRKLSSLRKFVEFSIASNFVAKDFFYLQEKVENLEVEKNEAKNTGAISLNDIEAHKIKLNYSPIPPIRLLQKLIILPYLLLESAIAGKIISLLYGNAALALAAKKTLPVLGKIQLPQKPSDLLKVKGYEKEFYAPNEVSLDNYPFHKKAWYHIRHTRPEWYRRYHNLPLVHYIHFAVLIIFAAGAGVALYRNLVTDVSNPLFAAPTSPPRILSFQGRLTDNFNNPITSSTSIRFSIYDDLSASGSALLWQEVHYGTIPDQDGIFSVLLGTNNSIPDSVFFENNDIYLGVTIEQTAELTPRRRIASVPYAANSESLQGMLPITDGGAGQTNVVLALDSSGDLTIGGSATPTFSASGGQFTLSGDVLLLTTETGTDSNIVLSPDGLGGIDLQKPLFNTTATGNLTPGGVEINDKFGILATESAVASFTLNNDGASDLFTASSSGNTRFTIGNDGTLTIPVYNTAGGLLYANGSGVVDQTLAGTGTQCLLGGTTPTWGSCGTGTNPSPFQVLDGSIVPFNSTLDFIVGGQATDSAKFAVLNMNSGTPVASISATSTGNGLSLSGDGTIQSLRKNTLTFGGNTTGNINIIPRNNEGPGFGQTTNYGILSVQSYSSNSFEVIGPTRAFQIDSSTSEPTTYFLNSNDLFGFSGNFVGMTWALSSTTGNFSVAPGADIDTLSSGTLEIGNTHATTITLGRSGQGITLPGFTTDGGLFYANGSGVLAQTTSGSLGECLTSNGGGAPAWGECGSAGVFQELDGAIVPNNSTVDFLIGGQATDSARFAVLNINSGTPTASISANSGNIATYITGDGTLATTNRQTLTIGNSSAYDTTGNVLINPNGTGMVGIGTSSPSTALDIRSGALCLSDGSACTSGAVAAGDIAWDAATGGGSNGFQMDYFQGRLWMGNLAGNEWNLIIDEANDRVGINTVSPLAGLDVRQSSGTIPVASISGQTSAPALLVDNAAGSGNQFVASKSGEAVFIIDNDGNIIVGPSGSGKITASVIDPYLIQNQYTTGNTELTFQTMASSNGDFIFQNQSNNLATLFQEGLLHLEVNGSAGGLQLGDDTQLFRGATNRIDVGSGDSFNLVAGNYQLGGNTIIDSSGNATFNDITISGTCSGCVSPGTLSPFQIADGSIIPNNTTLDFLIGGQATASADFAVLNVNGTGPATASVSGNLIVMPNNGAGGRVGIGTNNPSEPLEVNGNIKISNDINGALVLGRSDNVNEGGQINFIPAGSYDGWIFDSYQNNLRHYTNSSNTNQIQIMNVGSGTAGLYVQGKTGIGTTNPDSQLHLTRDLTDGATGKALAIFDQIENQDIFTASAGGTTRFTIGNNGILTASAYTTNGGLIYTNGSGVLAQTGAGTGSQCLLGGTTPTWGSCTTGTTPSPFTELDGSIVPNNTTLDFLLGGQSTDSAKFAVLNVNGTGPATASVSGNLIVMPNNGAGGRVGIGIDSPNARLHLRESSNNIELLNGTYGLFASGNDFASRFYIDANSNAIVSLDKGAATNNAAIQFLIAGASNWNVGTTDSDIAGNGNEFFIGRTAGGANPALFIDSNDTVGIGTTAPASALHVTRPLTYGATGKALAIFDQIENQDIFTASAGGTTRFTIGNNGILTLSAYTTNGGLIYTNGSGVLAQTGAGTGSQCLLGGTTPTWGSCAAGGTDSPFQVSSGTIQPLNSTLDFLIGGQATASADFAVLNVNGTGPATASVSGNLIVMPNNGAGGNVGINNTSPLANLDVRGSSTGRTLAGALSDFPAYGAIGFNETFGLNAGTYALAGNSGGETLLNAPTGGSIQFRINNAGYAGLSSTGLFSVGFTASPLSQLHVSRPLTYGVTGKALAIFDQIENQDIFTASAGGTTRFTITNDGRVGINTNTYTYPTGTAKGRLAIHGTDSSSTDGPHVNFTTSADSYPLLQMLPFSHDNVALSFDSYWDGGSWISSHASHAYQIYKIGDRLDFKLGLPGAGVGSSFVTPLYINGNGKIGIGDATALGQLTVTRPLSYGATGKALATFDQIENQDIFTASSSGTPRFSITNAGGVKLGTSEGASGECLQSGGTGSAATWGVCSVGSGGVFQELDGAIVPNNSTLDFLIGAQATSSAKFSISDIAKSSNTILNLEGSAFVRDLVADDIVLSGLSTNIFSAYAGFNGYTGFTGGIGTGGNGKDSIAGAQRIDSIGNLKNIASIQAGETLLTNGGKFAAKVDYTAGNAPEGAAVGDLNGDGYADLAVVNNSDNDVSVFINDGDGTFAAKADYTTGTGPRNVDIGDLDGDGWPDLVITNFGTTTFSVFINDGDGTFAAKVDYTANNSPHGIAVGDLNGDGKNDVALTNQGSDNVSVFINDGDGTFAAKADYTTGDIPEGIALGDVNGDGYADLAVGNVNVGNVSVFINDGDGTFAAKADYTTDAGSAGIAMGDVNGDGKNDLVVANHGAHNVSIMLNDGDGTFTEDSSPSTLTSPLQVAIGDISGDGKPDLAVSNNSGNAFVSIFINNGNGTFAAKVDYGTGSGSRNVAVGDLNNDGKSDIVSPNISDDDVSVLINQARPILYAQASTGFLGIGTTSPASQLYVTRPLTHGVTGKALAIFDQIENQDIFTASSSGTPRFVIKNDGSVGINTANPQAQFHTFKSGTNDPLAIFESGNGGSVMFSGQTGALSLKIINNPGDDNFITGSVAGDSGIVYNNAFGFLIGPEGSNVALRIDGDNKIGIGTNSPISQFQVTRNLANGATGKALALFNQTENQDIFTASASGTPRFVIKNDGSVGIGTSLPSVKLDVEGGNIQIDTATTLSAPDRWMGRAGNFGLAFDAGQGTLLNSPANLLFQIDSDNDDSDIRKIIFAKNGDQYSGGETAEGSHIFVIDESGEVTLYGDMLPNADDSIELGSTDFAFNTVWTNAVQAGGSDLAEYFKKSNSSEEFEAGQLVCLTNNGGITKCSNTESGSILGVVSDNAGFIGGSDHSEDPNYVLVGLVGQLDVRVTGDIKVGDSLTISPLTGVAAKAEKEAYIIGRAMESNLNGQKSRVATAIQSGYYNPNLALNTAGDETETFIASLNINQENGVWNIKDTAGNIIDRTSAFSNLIAATVKAGLVNAQKVTANTLTATTGVFSSLTSNAANITNATIGSLSVGSENVLIAGTTLRDYVAGIVEEVIADNIFTTDNEIISPVASIDRINTNIISPLGDGASIEIEVKPESVAINNTDTGEKVAEIDNEGNATFSGQLASSSLSTNDATISGTLSADRIIANSIDGLDERISSIAGSLANNNQSTPSGNIAYADEIETGNIYADFGIYSEGLTVLGSTTTSQLTAMDSIAIGTGFIMSDNSLNTLGATLQIQPLRQGNIDFMAGRVKIDTDGNMDIAGNLNVAGIINAPVGIFNDLKVSNLATNIISPLGGNDLTIKLGNETTASNSSNLKVTNSQGDEVLKISGEGNIAASGSATFDKLNFNLVGEALADSDTTAIATGSAGFATLNRNKPEITIYNDKITENSLIYITPFGDTQNKVLYLLRQVPHSETNDGSFTVGVSGVPSTRDLQFNWLIVN